MTSGEGVGRLVRVHLAVDLDTPKERRRMAHKATDEVGGDVDVSVDLVGGRALMARKGENVTDDHERAVTRHDKLVRDRIPEFIAAEGTVAITRVLEVGEFARQLRAKLDEELAEFDASGAVEELVDLQEIVYALAALQGVTNAELDALRQMKRTERGGFERRLLLRDVRPLTAGKQQD
jgi:predicted house-cleaning noncanonical NTP pyrophosphatase (MazG superfamily)